MAELTYNDIKEAILEALADHDRYTARYGNADQKIRKETNKLTQDLLDSVKLGFKTRKSQDQEFLNKLERKIFSGKEKSWTDENGDFGFGSKLEKSFGNFLNKASNSWDKFYDKLSKNATLGILTRWNTMSNEATQQVVDSLKVFNASGISQDWNQFTYSLRDSTVTLEDFVNAAKQHNTAFQILNKSTGNAANAYQSLAKSASEFAIKQGNVAYDNAQLSEAIGSYLEMQRSTGNLDKINQKEMQNGVNRLIVSADKLAKEFGLNRDELLKNAQKPNDDVDVALSAMGYSPDEIADIKDSISLLKISNPQLAKALENQIATGGYDSNALAIGAMSGSENVNRAWELIRAGQAREGAQLLASQETMDQLARNAPTGNIAGILNMKGNEITSELAKIQLNAKRAVQTKGASTETDKTIVAEQAYRNELIKKDNNVIALLTKSAEGATAQFKLLTATVATLNSMLSYGVLGKNLINSFAPFISQMLGVSGGLLSTISYLASYLNQLNSFRTLTNANSVLDIFDASSGKAGKALRSVRQVRNLRKLAKAKPWVKGVARLGGKAASGITRFSGRVIGGIAKGAPWAIAADIGAGLVDEYGSKGLESLGVGKKTAKVTSNAVSSALSGAGYGAMIGSIIPGVGTAIGAGIGALIGGVGSLVKSSTSGVGGMEKEQNVQQQQTSLTEEDEIAEYRHITQAQQEEMINQLRRIANGMENVDYNTNNMVKYNF